MAVAVNSTKPAKKSGKAASKKDAAKTTKK